MTLKEWLKKVIDERKPWDQQEGEPNRWYQRFNSFRLAGPGRSWLSVYCAEWKKKQEREGNSGKSEPKRLPGSWDKYAKEFQIYIRAQAWDQYLANLAETEIESAWRAKVMGGIEVLGRMSEIARNDVAPFFKMIERWTENPLPIEEILKEEEYEDIVLGIPIKKIRYLVKKIVLNMDAFLDPALSFRVKEFSDSPKNGLSFKLYDAPAALTQIGKHNGALAEKDNQEGKEIPLITIPADLISPTFLAPLRDIRDRRHLEYIFYGGRGSTKSSFVSLVIIWLLVNNPNFHALIMRQVAETLRDSAYAQLVWAINELNNYFPALAGNFNCTKTPMEITYIPTGQKIYFRGADDPGKIKSIKPAFGAISLLWFEEAAEFHGSEAIRNITQSAIRGTDAAFIFKTYNPPRTSGNWINKYVLIPKESQYQHKSDYRSVPIEWLGQIFIDEAEHLKEVNPESYEHEYLGEVNGLGDQVFSNLILRKISDEEIAQFERVCHGLDFGFYPDPAHYSRVHYDAARLTLYIFGEVRKWKTSNRDMYTALTDYGLLPDDLLICDSEDPKSIADYRDYGSSARGAEKGPSSVKYSIKWLQSLKAIVIDPERCPYSVGEFTDYAYERTKDGEIIEAYPDENNHAIDSVRYATNLIWRRRGQ